MAAKLELEAYVNSSHPHPQYLRHLISSYCDTAAKQLAVEASQFVADGIPQDTARKDVCSVTVNVNNGHMNTDTETGLCFDVTFWILYFR